MKGLAFYEAAAQIIPLLYIVVLIQMRLFGFTAYPGARIHRTLWILFVVFGEVRALWVLYGKHTIDVLDPGFVATATMVAALPLVVGAFAQLFPEHARPGNPMLQEPLFKQSSVQAKSRDADVGEQAGRDASVSVEDHERGAGVHEPKTGGGVARGRRRTSRRKRPPSPPVS